jgi:hypothetical protein
VTTATRPDQTYLVILGAATAQASQNARVLAQYGDNQLGRPYPALNGYRNWNGNLIRHGHHDRAAFVRAVNTVLPSHMYVDRAHHWHARLNDGQWIRCPANTDGAVPLTIAITQTRGD